MSRGGTIQPELWVASNAIVDTNSSQMTVLWIILDPSQHLAIIVFLDNETTRVHRAMNLLVELHAREKLPCAQRSGISREKAGAFKRTDRVRGC